MRSSKEEEEEEEKLLRYHTILNQPMHVSCFPFPGGHTAQGKHTGDMGPIKATNLEVESPPQALSMTFNESGKVTRLTVRSVFQCRQLKTSCDDCSFDRKTECLLRIPLPMM